MKNIYVLIKPVEHVNMVDSMIENMVEILPRFIQDYLCISDGRTYSKNNAYRQSTNNTEERWFPNNDP